MKTVQQSELPISRLAHGVSRLT